MLAFPAPAGTEWGVLAGYNTDMCVCATTAGYKNLVQDFDVFLPRYLKRRSHARRTEMVPAPLRWITHLDPIFYFVSGLRYGMLGVSDVDVRVSMVLAAADRDEVLAIYEEAIAETHRRGSILTFAAAKVLRVQAFVLRGDLTEAEAEARARLDAKRLLEP